MAFFQFFGSRDIGGNHHLFDQPVRVEPGRHMDVLDHALVVEDDLAFRQVEIERPPAVARLGHGAIGGPERL